MRDILHTVRDGNPAAPRPLRIMSGLRPWPSPRLPNAVAQVWCAAAGHHQVVA
jgi:hypothetical protein